MPADAILPMAEERVAEVWMAVEEWTVVVECRRLNSGSCG